MHGKADIWLLTNMTVVYMAKLTFDIIINPSQMCVKSNHICYTFTCSWNASKLIFATYLHSIANMFTDLLHICIIVNIM